MHLVAVAHAAAAAACLAAAVAWQGGSTAAALGAAAGLCLAGVAARRRLPLPVGAVAAHPDPARWQVLTDQGWQRAVLRHAGRGGGSLSLRLDGAAGASLDLTVWRSTLRPAAWRRLCVLACCGRVAGGAS
ncbi:hypothetical protein [Bordetella sp. 2513F-2]